MAAQKKLYLTVQPGDPDFAALDGLHHAGDRDAVTDLLRTRFGLHLAADKVASIAVHSMPRNAPETAPHPLVIGLSPQPAEHADALHAHVNGSARLYAMRVASDHRIHAADCWCPGTGQIFGTMDRAKALLGAAGLPPRADGSGVNVVIVDHGVNYGYLPTGQTGQWNSTFKPTSLPGLKGVDWTFGGAPFGHGTKMALAVLALAPKAKIWDLPLLPPQIHGLGSFLSDAQAAFDTLQHSITQGTNAPSGSAWVICNAWGVYDLEGDTNYRMDPTHEFTGKVSTFTNADLFFAAGNCGLACPAGRCGNSVIGPGNGIFGVAALSNVLTVGAVRNDGVPLGYSSAGPAPATFTSPNQTNQKPNLVLPSQFAYGTGGIATGGGDPNWSFTGTSTACALAAGTAAALRTVYPPGSVSPLEMVSGLTASAQPLPGQPPSSGNSFNIGAGLLSIPAFVRTLPPRPG